jgi:hypothetical protein
MYSNMGKSCVSHSVLNLTPFHVRSLTDKVALVQIYFPQFRYYLDSIVVKSNTDAKQIQEVSATLNTTRTTLPHDVRYPG